MKLAFSSYEPSGDVSHNLPPVIMLHGILDSRKTWMKIAPKIANQTGRKVYVLDSRNHGESPWSDDFDIEIMANDLEEFMNANRIQKAALVGHSMGGKIAMKFATEKSERVEKLIIEDMIPRPFSLKGWQIIVIAIELLKESLGAIPVGANEFEAKVAIGKFMKENIPMLTPTHDPELGMRIMPLKNVGNRYEWETNLDVLGKHLTSNENFDKALTNSYNGDALFIYGTKSFIKVENEPSVPKFFPRALSVPIIGATHIVHFDKPKEFIYEVVTFINRSFSVPQLPLSKY